MLFNSIILEETMRGRIGLSQHWLRQVVLKPYTPIHVWRNYNDLEIEFEWVQRGSEVEKFLSYLVLQGTQSTLRLWRDRVVRSTTNSMGGSKRRPTPVQITLYPWAMQLASTKMRRVLMQSWIRSRRNSTNVHRVTVQW